MIDLEKNGLYILLYQKLVNSRIFKNSDLLQLWIYLLLTARLTETWVPFKTGRGVTEVHLLPGQLIFGRNSVGEKLGQKPSSVWKRLQKLKSVGNCDIESNSHYSIVTICNWGDYQAVINTKEHGKEQASDRQGTGKEQASDTNKIDKKVKKVKKSITLSPEEQSFYNRFDDYVLDTMQRRMKSVETQKGDLQVILRNRKIKDRLVTIAQLDEILEFVKGDSYWRGNNMQTFSALKGKTNSGIERVEFLWHKAQSPQRPEQKRHTQPCPKDIKPG